MAMVISAPSAKPLNGFEVIESRVRSSLPPDTLSSPVDIMFMPNRKKESPPMSVNKEKMSM